MMIFEGGKKGGQGSVQTPDEPRCQAVRFEEKGQTWEAPVPRVSLSFFFFVFFFPSRPFGRTERCLAMHTLSCLNLESQFEPRN